jgi:hypothetical protein
MFKAAKGKAIMINLPASMVGKSSAVLATCFIR